MQTFESGGVLLVRPERHRRAMMIAFAFGAAMMAVPPMIGLYLLLIA